MENSKRNLVSMTVLFASATIALLFALTALPFSAHATAVENGWGTGADSNHYYQNGQLVTSSEFFDPSTDGWYYAEADGSIAHGVYWIASGNGKWVYYDMETGAMAHGEACLTYDAEHQGWYYFDEITGEMAHGVMNVTDNDGKSKWVYYDFITGVMAHGEECLTYDADHQGWYYFDEITGEMAHGVRFVTDGAGSGKWVYYDFITGVMAHGEDYLSYDKDHTGWYYFDPTTGEMAHGLTLVSMDNGTTKTCLYHDTMGWMLYGDQVVNGYTLHFDTVTGALTASSQGSKVVEIALTKIGSPYKHAGMGPDEFSCDGFTYWVYKEAGMPLYETMADTSFNAQYKYLNDRGRIVTNIAQLKPGDVMFFGTSFSNMRHAAIYYGVNERGQHEMIHASMPGVGVVIGPLDSDFLGGGSPL